MAATLMIATLVATTLAVPGPRALADGVGTIAFEGTASLPEFPCPLPFPPEPPCEGTFDGTVSGTLSGPHLGTRVWLVSFTDVLMTASFSYADGTCVDGVASGEVTILGGPGSVSGTYDAGGFARPVEGIWIDAEFEWNRDGVVAHIFPIRNGTVRIDVAGIGWLAVAADAVGAGAAAFVPHVEPGDVTDCVEPGDASAITADVAGTATLGDAS